MKKTGLFFILLHACPFILQAALSVSQQPFAVIYTPDSVLKAPPGSPVYAASRSRYSTCPGITWAQGDEFLITANYLGKFVGVFKYSEEDASFQFVYRLGNEEGMQLGRAADVSITKDGSVLAVGNSGEKLNLYEITDQKTCAIHPVPIKMMGELRYQRMHGVTFSSDSRYLAYTTIDDPDQICIYRLDRTGKGSLSLALTQKLQNLYHPLKPKAIAFSPDDHYVALCFSERSQKDVSHKGRIASYAFDSQTGKIHPKPLSVTLEGAGIGLISPEGIVFSGDGLALFVTDQVLDTVTMYEFLAEKGTIGNPAIVLKNPEAELNFPHGIALSSNGKRLAVTNLGEDKINIYTISD